MVSDYFYLISLSDGDHLRILYKIWSTNVKLLSDLESSLSNSSKNVFIQSYWCPDSKLDFFKMELTAIFDSGLWKKLPGFLGGTWRLNFFIKGPKKSNQVSNLTSQRMVTESGFMTLLVGMQERQFNFFLGDQIFLNFSMPLHYWKIGKKQHFTCAYLT